MNEKEIDAEMKRLKKKKVVKEKKTKLDKLKEEVEPSLLGKAWKAIKDLGDEIG